MIHPGRYFRIINFIKISCILLVILVSYLVYNNISKFRKNVILSTNEEKRYNGNNFSDYYDTYTENSTFQSVDRKNKPLSIYSKKAIKLGEGLYQLEVIQGRYYLTPEQPVLLYADIGKFDDINKIVYFANVTKFYYDAYIINTRKTKLNLNDFSATGADGITILYSDSAIIQANKFDMQSKSKILHLHGNVQVFIHNLDSNILQ